MTEAWLGITIFCEKGFPEFDRFHPQLALWTAHCKWSFNIGIISMKNQECIVCGNRLSGRQTHFCSIKCKNDYHQSYEAQQRRGLIRKLQLVQLKGGKCSICGYRKNLSALVFHHADADEKEFKLDMRSLSNRTLTEVMRELDKCILVCANCHAEIHNANLDLDLLL